MPTRREWPAWIASGLAGLLAVFATAQVQPRLLQILIYLSVSIVVALTIARSRRVEAALRSTLAEQRQAQTALESSEKRFRALIEHSWDAVALFSADGRILYGSPATTRVLGYELENFVGRSAFEFINPDDHPFVIGRIQRALDQPGANVDVHARVLHANGQWRELEGVFTNLLADPAVGAIVNNYRDVTERRQLERQFLQAQKMEAIGQLAGGVANDFNNLLTVIIGHVEMAMTPLAPAARVRGDLEEIRKATRRGAALTYQLDAFARRHVILPREIDLTDLLQRLDEMPAADAVAPAPQAAEPARTLLTGTETILLAEDEEGVRAVAADVLRQCGYVVLEAATPAEALRTEAQHGEVIHLLVTDVIMPHMSGQELSRQLTMRRAALKTLFISGYTDSAMIQQEMLHDGVAYLPKPFTPQELAATVRRVLDQPTLEHGLMR